MTTIAKSYPGHWSDAPEVDARVSHAEQQDHMPPVGAPGRAIAAFFLFLIVGIPSVWAAAAYLIQR